MGTGGGDHVPGGVEHPPLREDVEELDPALREEEGGDAREAGLPLVHRAEERQHAHVAEACLAACEVVAGLFVVMVSTASVLPLAVEFHGVPLGEPGLVEGEDEEEPGPEVGEGGNVVCHCNR